ncbi:MAG: RES family NAD+ phosphorylase, partial [Planctomycetia bacterium]|nr:RES family NAD+ phosphorylase [Planctomycetia bacterium]
MIQAYRLAFLKFADQAFSGEGAMRFGGRWNSRGTALVYSSATRALATLELLVHVKPSSIIDPIVLFSIEFPEELVEIPNRCPSRWSANPPSALAQQFGDDWAAENRSAVLRVPSAIVPNEFNYLLNPNHPDF